MRFLKDLSFGGMWGIGFLLLTQAGSCLAAKGGAAPIEVFGWPIPDLSPEKPPLGLGDDPVIGRQTCPPLTRLNLALKRSEDLLLRKISESSLGKEVIWTLEMRPGLFWWGGQQVSSDDLVRFLESNLPILVADRGAGLWEVPDFKVRAEGALRISIQWSQRPQFGPYILSGAPLYRSKKNPSANLQYECVGLYQPHMAEDLVILSPTTAYKSNNNMPEIFLHRSRVRLREDGARSIEFRVARDLNRSSIGNDPQVPCKLAVDLPITTMILWNTQAGVTKDPAIRRALTQLTPRGALVRSGTGLLGDLSASLVPKEHPGFDSNIPMRPFDMKAADLTLDSLGYKRHVAGGLRQGPDGHDLELLIISQKSTTGLPEKVISDAFTAAGVGVKFSNETDSERAPDGVLASFTLDWPRASLLGNFHSRVPMESPFWPVQNLSLDQSLEDYAASLTFSAPEFSKLFKVQDLLYDLEPATVIFQHRACVITGSGLRPFGKSFTLNDPDWFRQLLF